MVFEVKVFGFKKMQKTFRVIAKNIPIEMSKSTLNELKVLEGLMKKKTEKFRWRTGKGISISDSFVIDTPKKDKNTVTHRLRNIAPHAIFNEFGFINVKELSCIFMSSIPSKI